MAKFLSDFAVGESGKILSVSGGGAIRRRLFDMGVTPGADVVLRKKSAARGSSGNHDPRL